jgi:hypothetical protein
MKAHSNKSSDNNKGNEICGVLTAIHRLLLLSYLTRCINFREHCDEAG